MSADSPANTPLAHTGNSLADTYVICDAPNGDSISGIIVKGTRDPDGTWDLDGVFTVKTDDDEIVRVNGWTVSTEIQ